jgi:spoIIIJ-associated protein
MIPKRTTLELIAPSVDEAIQNGLAELGLPRAEVDIEILDEGTRGLFGLGVRHARVRLTVKKPGIEKDDLSQAIHEMATSSSDETESMEESDELDIFEEIPSFEDEEEEAVEGTLSSAQSLMDDLAFHVVRETVNELLQKLGFSAELEIHYGDTDEKHPRPPILVDIHGEDLSMLIGKRAETMNAFQYIAGLIASKELGRNITLVIDIEGYRERRYNQVRQIARRMADQAVKTGRRQFLEPMPANERRIVHMELRENPVVRTESTGEDPYRKVTIVPMK